MWRTVPRLALAAARSLADFVAEDRCHVCGAEPHGDSRCLDGVRAAVAGAVQVGWFTNHPVCVRCASRLDTATGIVEVACTPHPVRLASPFHTNATLLELVHRVKFSRMVSIADLLARATALAARDLVATLHDPILVPVPMDPRSLRQRGFNQAQRIATTLSRRWGIPLAEDAVVKPDATRPQSLAARHERLANVLGAYRAGPATVRGRHVIVVDDLVTTGATLTVIGVVLAGAGAASVSAVSAGRSL